MLTRHDSPLNSVKDVVATAKASPGRLSVGSTASVGQLTGELLKLNAGIVLTGVPYKSFSAAVTDLVGKQLDLHIEPIPSALPMVKA